MYRPPVPAEAAVHAPALVFLQAAVQRGKPTALVDWPAASRVPHPSAGVLAAFADGNLVALNVRTETAETAGASIITLHGGPARPTKALLVCNLGLVLAGFADGSVLLWQLDGAASDAVGCWPARRFRKQASAIRALALDRVIVAAANSDGIVCLWDIQTGQCLRELSSTKECASRPGDTRLMRHTVLIHLSRADR